MKNATTRWATNRFPHSPFWLVAVDWPDECCPTCRRSQPEGTQVAFDEDVRACFCLTCAAKWLKGDEEAKTSRRRRAPHVVPRQPPSPTTRLDLF